MTTALTKGIEPFGIPQILVVKPKIQIKNLKTNELN